MALDPNHEIDEFIARTTASHERYVRLFDSVDSQDDRTQLRKGLSVDAAFRLGVEWERLQHRWHVAAIRQEPSKFIGQYERRIQELDQRLSRELKTVFRASTVHRKVTRLRLSEIEILVDPQDRNLSFADTSAWLAATTRDLGPSFIERVSRLAVDPQSASLLDLIKGIRNYVAHGSKDAAARLKRLASLRRPDSPEGLIGHLNAPLIRPTGGIGDLGTYLNRDLGYPASTRVTFLYDRARDIAAALRRASHSAT